MTEAIQTIPAPSAANEPCAASANPAVARCMNAWTSTNKAERAKGRDKFDASMKADRAYLDAMPPLSGLENIRDFIACVAHAILFQIILDNQGARLLYAAQVAYSTVRTQSAPPKTAA